MRGVAALGIVLALVVLVVVLGRGKQTPPPGVPATPGAPSAVQPQPTGQGGIVVQSAVKVVVECENYESIEDKEPKSGHVVMKKGQASMGETIGYLEIPEGWIKTCGMEEDKGHPGTLPGKATYSIDLPREDTYYVFLRAKWYDSCGNSVYFRVDEGDWYPIDDTEGKIDEATYKWAWHPLREAGDPRELKLSAGKHTLTLAIKEDGPLLDKLLIATDATPPAQDSVRP